MTGYLAYLWLEAKRQWRNREALVFRLGLPTAVYLILRVTQGDLPGSTPGSGGLQALPAPTTRMVALAGLAAAISGLAAGPSLGEDRGNGWLRQLRATPLRASAAVTAKIVVAMSFALPSIALVAAVGGLTENITLTGAQWVLLVGLMWVATTPITALGALIGLAFTAQAAQGATTLTFVVLWLAGGIFTPLSNMPDALAAIAKTLPSHGVIQVGWSVATSHSLPASAAVVLAAWTAGAGTLAALAWRRVVAR